MSGDKRSVHTDALATLGTIIGADEARDAIHLAVEPVIAAEKLWPGADVGILPDGKASTNAGKMLGIVDPFIKGGVRAGDRFWLIVYPRQITSLRHVWAHPDFPQAENITDDARPETDVEASKKWIEAFAARLDQTPNRLMSAATEWLEYSDYTYENTETYKDHWGEFPEFWKHFSIVTGKDVDGRDGDYFFTCSC